MRHWLYMWFKIWKYESCRYVCVCITEWDLDYTCDSKYESMSHVDMLEWSLFGPNQIHHFFCLDEIHHFVSWWNTSFFCLDQLHHFFVLMKYIIFLSWSHASFIFTFICISYLIWHTQRTNSVLIKYIIINLIDMHNAQSLSWSNTSLFHSYMHKLLDFT